MELDLNQELQLFSLLHHSVQAHLSKNVNILQSIYIARPILHTHQASIPLMGWNKKYRMSHKWVGVCVEDFSPTQPVQGLLKSLPP